MLQKNQIILGAAAALVLLVAGGAIFFFMQQPATPAINVTRTNAVASTSGTSDAGQGTVSPGTTVSAENATNTGASSASRTSSIPGTVRNQYGDWQLSCDTPPGASFEQCAIIQNVTAEDQPNVGLSVIVLKTADNKSRLLRVLAPLGVLLPNGLGLNVNGNDMGRVAFMRCLPNGCIAEVVMDNALIDTLSNGTSAIFIVFKTPEEGIGIPVSLEGFKEGYAALP